MSDTLPTDEQRMALGEMIQAAFVEARMLGRDGKAAQVADLADAFHNVSLEMYGWGSWSVSIFRGMLEDYQKKYPESYSGKRDYIAMLDNIFPTN